MAATHRCHQGSTQPISQLEYLPDHRAKKQAWFAKKNNTKSPLLKQHI